MKPPARVAEIPALTGLRALLAWWVVVYHMTIPELAPLPPDGWLEPLRAHGYLAVDGFFVLSGFILSYVYRDAFAAGVPGIYPRFLLARLARLYPVHLAMTLVVLAMLGRRSSPPAFSRASPTGSAGANWCCTSPCCTAGVSRGCWPGTIPAGRSARSGSPTCAFPSCIAWCCARRAARGRC